MKTSIFTLISFLTASAMGAAAYLMTEKMIFLIVTFVVYFLAMMIIMRPVLNTYFIQERKKHELYKFVNSFIINLSVTNSVDKAYAAGCEGLGEDFNKLIQNLSESPRDTTYYLKNYFDSNIYQMFLNILDLYETQGGDVLALSSNLLLELSRVEDSRNIKDKDDGRNIKEFITMWGFALAIFLFMRFGLSSFYDFLKSNIVFQIGVGVFLAFFLASILIYSIALTGFTFSVKAKRGAKHDI